MSDSCTKAEKLTLGSRNVGRISCLE